MYLKGLQNCSSSKLAHTSRCPGIEPGLRRPYRFGRPGFYSRTTRSVPTLISCSFEALQDTEMYFTFLETSNLYLNGASLSGP